MASVFLILDHVRLSWCNSNSPILWREICVAASLLSDVDGGYGEVSVWMWQIPTLSWRTDQEAGLRGCQALAVLDGETKTLGKTVQGRRRVRGGRCRREDNGAETLEMEGKERKGGNGKPFVLAEWRSSGGQHSCAKENKNTHRNPTTANIKEKKKKVLKPLLYIVMANPERTKHCGVRRNLGKGQH